MRWRGLFLISALLFSFSPSLLFSQTEPSALPALIQKVEARRGTWTGYKAQIEIQFTAASGKQASCQGTLAYHRLDEMILLQCYGNKEKRVFTLKTTDREFELYLPGHRTVYKGSIFALEDSPAIESHLRAWDLYRAFKPMVIPSENTGIKTSEQGTIVTVLRVREGAAVPARELTVSPEGDIVSEIYYGLSGKTSVEIQRSEFQEIGAVTAGTSTAYPRHIRILSHKESGGEIQTHETVFHFKQADFLADFAKQDFEVTLPETTKIMELEDPLA
jgi:hypothetical protein